MIKKIAQTIEISFEIPESEKQQAREMVEVFKKVIVAMTQAKKHLNDMYEPFKGTQAVSPEELENIRGQVHRYKLQVKQNFEQVKLLAGYAMAKLNDFSSDTHITELENTFSDSFSDLEKQVNVLLEVMGEIEASDFRDKFIFCVDAIRTEAFELEKLINDRIIDYIDTNILAKTWMDDVQEALEGKIKSRIPYITQLFYERKKALE